MAEVKAIFRYVTAQCKSKFKNASCLLTVSVGQQTQEGERFRATMDLVNNSFRSCVVCINDSLQRHTMAIIKGAKEAKDLYDLSMQEGDAWLKRNEKYFDRLTIPLQIIRWDTWLNHPNFIESQNKIRTLINQDKSYKDAFCNAIDEFLVKYSKRVPNSKNFDLETAWKFCFDFVIEECASLNLWHELNCQYEVYPNKHNSAIEETRERFVVPSHPHLLKAVTIGFRNAGQAQPQAFNFASAIS